MVHKFCIAILFMVCIFSPVNGQHLIEGTVFGEAKALPYAHIIHHKGKFGIYANEQGKFSISIGDSLLKDSLLITCVGFNDLKIPIATLLNQEDIVLNLIERANTLQAIEIRPKEDKLIMLGTKKNNCITASTVSYDKKRPSYSSQEALYFSDPEPEQTTFVKSVAYFIKGLGVVSTPFRVRVYAFDTLTQLPGEDLLNTSLIVSAQSKGWFEVNLEQYQIKMPKQGLVVAMEWLLTNDEQYFYVPWYFRKKDAREMEKEDRVHFGQSIGSLKGENQRVFHGFQNLWFKGFSGYYPMIRLYLNASE